MINLDVLYIEIIRQFPNDGNIAKSKTEFCNAMKISKRTLYGWVENKSIPTKYIPKIKEVLPNINIDNLYKLT